jgi:glycosyltransferase involved in cell wall biosynthesis
VLSLSQALARAGHEVDLLATGPGGREERVEGSLHVRIFHRDWPPRVCPSADLRDALRSSDPGIIHHHSIWLRTLHYAHRRARARRAKFVISPRGMMAPWAWRHHRWRKQLAGRLIHPGALAAAHGWHATSQSEADDIRALGFEQPVCVAPNGVAAPSGAELEVAGTHWRQTCPEAFQRPTALFYSRFHPKKRVLELIDLWLERAPSDWLLLLVGIPETYTVAQLADYASRNLGGTRIRVFDGTSGPAPYVAASLFLLPSHSENFGLVVAEALAHGLPAVVTDATPWRSLDDAGYGWCVPWEEFGDVMCAALSAGPAALSERGSGARAWVLSEYSWENSARVLLEFYEQLGRR